MFRDERACPAGGGSGATADIPERRRKLLKSAAVLVSVWLNSSKPVSGAREHFAPAAHPFNPSKIVKDNAVLYS
jgi:hypothetical protein